MKKLALAFILLALAGCGNSKHDVFDKCLNQANQTYGQKIQTQKIDFMNDCMHSYGYVNQAYDDNFENSRECWGIASLNFSCYVKK